MYFEFWYETLAQLYVNLAVEKIPTINNSLSFRCSKVCLSIWAVENGKAGEGWGVGRGTGCQPPTPTILWNKTFLYIKLENIKVLLVNNKFIY